MPELVHNLAVVLVSQKLDFMGNTIITYPAATDEYLLYNWRSRFVLGIAMILSLMRRAASGVYVADVPPILSKMSYTNHAIPLAYIAKDCHLSVTSVDDVIDRYSHYVRDGNHTLFISNYRQSATAVYITPQMPSKNQVPFSDHIMAGVWGFC
ncbi:hypothetical protein DM01DRAFT_1370561 [Hesseltinella vesiculosa]|uniref:Uncharacterized protein n=1 Tax=Hesseltinella vesiculosa TaxID=101127 RepID=A0A1X2GU32_9FUNG|nr:hypothetical protein DM01DRAFT_1370561 [Hesseltinella vesiculosa]